MEVGSENDSDSDDLLDDEGVLDDEVTIHGLSNNSRSLSNNDIDEEDCTPISPVLRPMERSTPFPNPVLNLSFKSTGTEKANSTGNRPSFFAMTKDETTFFSCTTKEVADKCTQTEYSWPVNMKLVSVSFQHAQN